jgi:hypothetical protein
MLDFVFFLFLIILLAISVFIYRFHGRKEIVRFDIVQFSYAFVVAPVIFVWFKTFLHGLLQSQTDFLLTPRMIFMIDTVFSVYFLYMFGFIVIHSLTKSFQLQSSKDPLYDLFHHSEYFHLWLTHLITYAGSMIMIVFFAVLNVFLPLTIQLHHFIVYVVIMVGVVSGILFFVVLWMADPKQDEANFMRIMKMLAAILFIGLVGVYFGFNPALSSQYLFFWFGLFTFASIVSCSAFAYKSVKAKHFFERLCSDLLHRIS